MQTAVLPADDPASLVLALDILHSGGLVAFPTDTVYGVGALAFDPIAIASIYTAKARPAEKAIPVLIGDVDDLDKVSDSVPPLALILAARFWPGPLTLVLPKSASLPGIISANPTVGVRVPDHPAARALLQAAGPMAVTSANISGQPSPSSSDEVLGQLNGLIPLILDGGVTPGGLPSTVVNCLGTEPAILREGPLSRPDILKALGLD